MKISSNVTVYKQNFYQAEAAIAEGIQTLQDTELDGSHPSWVLAFGSSLLTTGSAGSEKEDVYSDSTWSTANSQSSVAFPDAEFMSAYRGVAQGNSLDVSAKRIHVYDVYGRSQKNRGLSIVKTSFRKAY